MEAFLGLMKTIEIRTPEWYYKAYVWMAKRWPDTFSIERISFLDGMVEHINLIDKKTKEPVDREIRVFKPSDRWVFGSKVGE